MLGIKSLFLSFFLLLVLSNSKAQFKNSITSFKYNPSPDAGPDDKVCGTRSYELRGKASLESNKLSWRETGSKAVIFLNSNDAVTLVEIISTYGTYEFELTEEDSLGNKGTDRVVIDFNQNPVTENIEKHCIRSLEDGYAFHTYKAILNISHGDPPYSLVIPPSSNNGTIIGSQWISNELNSLESFIVVVKDANDCESALYLDSYNCDCGIAPYSAGVMERSTRISCIGDCHSLGVVMPAVINPVTDVVMYLLHSSNDKWGVPTEILDTLHKAEDLICFDPVTMEMNKLYYVTEVSGKDINPKDGIVDKLNDFCENRYSNSSKIIFSDSYKLHAGNDIHACSLIHELNAMPAVAFGTWRQISGPIASFSRSDISNPKVHSSAPGKSEFVYSVKSSVCTIEDTITVNFYKQLSKSNISYNCPPSSMKSYFYVQIYNGTLPYSVIKGIGAIDSMGIYTSEFIPDSKEELIEIEDANGCRISVVVKHECSCTNDIGVMNSTPKELCQDNCLNIYSDNLYDNRNEKLDTFPRDTLMFFVCTDPVNPNGSLLYNLTTADICFDPKRMQYGTIYYIGAKIGRTNEKGDIDPIKGCVRLSVGTPVIWYEKPKPNAGPDIHTCASKIKLKENHSVDFSSISWSELNQNNILIERIDEKNTLFSIKKNFGCFDILMEESSGFGLCNSYDSLVLCFNPLIEIYNVVKIPYFRSGKIEKYKVTLQIKGGTAPIRVNKMNSSPGNLVNNLFVSDSIPFDQDFKLHLIDSVACDTLIFIDRINFLCGDIFAGELDTASTVACEDHCVAIKELIPEVIFQEDIAMYVLHKSSYNSTIIGLVLDTFFSKNDLICFNPKTMKFGIANPVYVTRVVGDDISPKDGIVDLHDPCRRASNNMKIIFEPYPVPDAGHDEKVCGNSYTLKGQLSYGSSTWQQILGPGTTEISDPSNPSENLRVDQYGRYCYEMVADHFGCVSSDTVCIEFYDDPKFISSSFHYLCDESGNRYKVIVNIVGGDKNTRKILGSSQKGKIPLTGSFNFDRSSWESDWIKNNADYNLILTDSIDCDSDQLSGKKLCVKMQLPDTVIAYNSNTQFKKHQNKFQSLNESINHKSILFEDNSYLYNIAIYNIAGTLLCSFNSALSDLHSIEQELKNRNLQPGFYLIKILLKDGKSLLYNKKLVHSY